MIATEFVAAGAHVYIASREEKAVKATAEELNRTGKGRCDWIAADLSTEAGVDHVVAELTKKEKRQWPFPVEIG